MIWRNFAIAVWISIAWCGFRLVELIRHADAVNRFYGNFTAQVVFFPILLGAAQLFLWFQVYQNRDRRARVLAGIVAGFFTLQLIIMALQASVQIRIINWDAGLFAYFAISHALFAFGGGNAALEE
jgi:hypothetical protein